ncbi:hypothetical protein K440DRAFT_638117 [Wilcoxina mikolae CBS 423.85]|nr:hypothetical protein K440DRAFT_638117 [Wilcoxina mikolae CBS 423.85]
MPSTMYSSWKFTRSISGSGVKVVHVVMLDCVDEDAAGGALLENLDGGVVVETVGLAEVKEGRLISLVVDCLVINSYNHSVLSNVPVGKFDEEFSVPSFGHKTNVRKPLHEPVSHEQELVAQSLCLKFSSVPHYRVKSCGAERVPIFNDIVLVLSHGITRIAVTGGIVAQIKLVSQLLSAPLLPTFRSALSAFHLTSQDSGFTFDSP